MIGIIGGTGMEELLREGDARIVATPFGPVEARVGRVAEGEAAVVLRHGPGHEWLPHQVNYRGNLWALRELGARQVLATSASGSLRTELLPGDLALLTDFIDLTRARVQTYQGTPGLPKEAEFYHADLQVPYCPRLRAALAAEWPAGVSPPEVTYACMEGPRYESPAEIRMLACLGADVVGMTGMPEAALAREIGLCYAGVAIVTNAAAGLDDAPLEHSDVERFGRQAVAATTALLQAAIAALEQAAEPCCPAAARRRRWFGDSE